MLSIACLRWILPTSETNSDDDANAQKAIAGFVALVMDVVTS
jgi:hypothetical protein